MHEEVLPRGSGRLLDSLERAGDPTLKGWILAGGTGLALQLGHRVSRDFDFFRTGAFEPRALRAAFEATGPCDTLQEETDTLTILAARSVKCSFFRVRDPFLYPPLPYRFFGVADPRDIGLMKLAAIGSRGSRRDFVDLHALLRAGMRLQELLERMPDKYGAHRVNAYHILRSLVWFDDAEKEPMPHMLQPFSWAECRDFFLREAHALIL